VLAVKVPLLIRHHIKLWPGRANFLPGRCITAEAHEDSIMAIALRDSTSGRICCNRFERALIPSFRVEICIGTSGTLEEVSEPSFGDQDKRLTSA
jgi:hypothetical protein